MFGLYALNKAEMCQTKGYVDFVFMHQSYLAVKSGTECHRITAPTAQLHIQHTCSVHCGCQ